MYYYSYYTHMHRPNTGTDTGTGLTYDEIKLTEVIPIYDTPVEREAIELHTNTAYDRPVIRQEIINVHDNTAYGQV